MQTFSFIPLMTLRQFLNIFVENLTFWLPFRLPWQPIKINDLDKINMVCRGLLQEHFCKTFVKYLQ